MIQRIQGRALIACLLAVLGLLAIAAGVVSAGPGSPRRLSAAARIEGAHCSGSQAPAPALSRLCNHARVASSRHRGPHGQGPGIPATGAEAVVPSAATATPTSPPPPELESESAPISAGMEPPAPEPAPAPVPEAPETPEPGAPEATEPPSAPEVTESPETAPIASGTEPPSGPAPASNSIYWGAWIGEQLTGTQAPWDMGAVSKFEQMTKKPMSLIHFSAPFADCSSSPCSFHKFPSEEMQDIRQHGSIPFFSWASQSTPASVDEPEFQLADVIAGKYDSYIREFAEGAKEWGHPFFLRFNWEMNGNWFEWSEGVNGNQPGEYASAWRHVHDIFAEVGAANATWVWCPNVDPEGNMQDLRSLYPGDAYVDWTGLDGYNSGTNPIRPDRWRSFDQLYSSTYREITETIAPTKPLIIGEVGSSEAGGSKAAWIEEMLSTIPIDYPKIRGVLWFDKSEGGMDWPIESSPSATEAFADGIENSIYADSRFGSLGPGPIPFSG